MAQVSYSQRALSDLERLFEFLASDDPSGAMDAIDTITDAIEVLVRHPLIGRPAQSGMRELVILRGKSGYIALYDYLRPEDKVRIAAIRHQREAGFTEI